MESLREDLTSMEHLSCLRAVKGTGRFYYLTPLLDEAEEVVEFCSHCLKWQDAWSGGDYNGFSHQSDWITDHLFNGNVMALPEKYSCFFQSGVKNSYTGKCGIKRNGKAFWTRRHGAC